MSQSQMYHAMNNSPKTALAAAITTAANVVPVDDASRLPAAPNLAVIGSDIDAEIVKYTAKDGNSLTGVTRGVNGTTAKDWPVGTIVARNFTAYDHELFKNNIEDLETRKVNTTDLEANYYPKTQTYTKEQTDEIAEALEDRIEAIEESEGLKRYGISGYGQEACANLTRLYDAVGMVAQVGTDGDNTEVRNDFDNAAPFMLRKCVGRWELVDNKPKFIVNAYEGEAGFAEDGSAGDYVAIEYPLSYYMQDGTQRGISCHPYEGYKPFDIFRRNHDRNDLLPKVYGPAYKMALKDNKPVSLPGLEPENGSYYSLRTTARLYGDGSLADFAILQPAMFDFYEEFLMSIEFATGDMQTKMRGFTEIRINNDDRIVFRDATHILTNNYQAGRVVGERIAILPTTVDVFDGSKRATHTIISVIRCDENGQASASGTHQLLEVEDLGRGYYTYDTTGETEYRIAGRALLTGSCSGVSTSSGSVGSNTDGLHPCKYRGRENPYGNIMSTLHDLFTTREGTDDSDWYLDWYYMADPGAFMPSQASEPSAAQLATYCHKLSVNTPHANYANGYFKTKLYDATYPDIWIPGEMGGSASTYFADQAPVVSTRAVRAVRSRGHWNTGRQAGPGSRYAINAPSIAYASYGGDLWINQWG